MAPGATEPTLGTHFAASDMSSPGADRGRGSSVSPGAVPPLASGGASEPVTAAEVRAWRAEAERWVLAPPLLQQRQLRCHLLWHPQLSRLAPCELVLWLPADSCRGFPVALRSVLVSAGGAPCRWTCLAAVGCQEQQGLEAVWTALFLTVEQQVTSRVSGPSHVSARQPPAPCFSVIISTCGSTAVRLLVTG